MIRKMRNHKEIPTPNTEAGKIHTIPSSWTNNVIKVFISWISKFCVSVNMYEIYLSSYISRLHTIVFILWIAKRFTTAVMVGGDVR